MTALAADRGVVMYGEGVHPKLLGLGIKANHRIYQGALVVNEAGVCASASTATGLVALGVANAQFNNLGGSANALNVQIETGVFDFANSAAADLIASTEVGKDVYIVDDQTVAKTDGSATRSRAGKCVKVENGRVFVLVGIGA